jgi:protoporphyrinogen oxidase
VIQDRRIRRIEHNGSAVTAFVAQDANGLEHVYQGRQYLSTLPIRSLVRGLRPSPPRAVLDAAESLKYRDFLTVVLIVDQPETFPDNWIYVHEPQVKLGRVQNFKNWSPDLVPDPSTSSLGLEYFCFEGDDLWNRTDDELIAQVIQSRYASGAEHLAVIRAWLQNLGNLSLAGRNGMHKYNNQDHSMMTALLCARNILGQGSYDPWRVNTDAEYHEEQRDLREDAGGRAVPRPLSVQVPRPSRNSTMAQEGLDR